MGDINTGLMVGAPTLEQRMGIQSPAGNMVKNFQNIGDYLAQQNMARQSLLLDQAKTLSGYQNMYMAYTGQRNPNIDAVLKQNPYGQAFMGQMGAANPNQSQPGNIPMASPNGSGGLSMGMVPGMALGSSITPSSSAGGSITPSNQTPSSGPVITGGSSTFDTPFGKFGQTTANPQGEADVARAKALGTSDVTVPETYAKDLAGKKSAAAETIIRDKSNLGMLQGAYDSLMNKYDAASKAGFAGNQYDAWRGKGMTNGEPLAFMAPGFNNFGQFGYKPGDLANIAGFQAIRNEVMTKMQPLMSQQFGQAGSVRIMESLLNMAQQEVGDLNNPREAFAAKAQATLENFNRIANSGVNYAKILGLTPNDLAKMDASQINQVANQIWGLSKQPDSLNIPGSQFNPKGTSGSLEDNSQASNVQPTRDQIMAELQRRQALKGQ